MAVVMVGLPSLKIWTSGLCEGLGMGEDEDASDTGSNIDSIY